MCGHFDIHSQELSLYKNQKHSRKGRKEYVKENRFTPKPYRLALCSSYEGLLETACDTLFTTALRVLASAAVGLQVGSGLPCSLDLLQSLLLLWPHSNTAVVEVTINGGREHCGSCWSYHRGMMRPVLGVLKDAGEWSELLLLSG